MSDTDPQAPLSAEALHGLLRSLPSPRIPWEQATEEWYGRLYDAKDQLAAEVERLRREMEEARADRDAILRIVAVWIDDGETSAGDLACRLDEAGYPLPDLGAPEPDDATPEGSREDLPAGGVDWTEEEGAHWDRELMERVAQGGSVDMGELRTQLPVLLEELDEVTAEAERERARAAEAERALERHTTQRLRQMLGGQGGEEVELPYEYVDEDGDRIVIEGGESIPGHIRTYDTDGEAVGVILPPPDEAIRMALALLRAAGATQQ